jgi:hypothetical protein
MTGKRALWQARFSSCGLWDGAGAGVVLGDVGCPEELTSPMSFPVPAGISKSGASPLAAVARTPSAKPLSRRCHDPRWAAMACPADPARLVVAEMLPRPTGPRRGDPGHRLRRQHHDGKRQPAAQRLRLRVLPGVQLSLPFPRLGPTFVPQGQIIWQEVSFQGTNDRDNIQRARMLRSVPIIVATRATLRVQVPTTGAF